MEDALFDVTFPEGDLEKAVSRELDQKVAAGILDADLFAGQIAQAKLLAREVDRSAGIGRPSGRAQLHDVLRRLLAELPAPEVAPQSSELERVLAAILDEPQP